MGAVNIGANAYVIYGSQAGAVAHLAGSITSQSAGFIAAVPDKQAQALVSATRVFNRQKWLDAYTTFAAREAVVAIVEASYELASLLLAKPTLFDQKTASSNIESVTAGPVSVQFFGPQDIGRFAPSVLELIREYLAGYSSSSSGGAEALGDGECAETAFDNSYDLY